MLSMCPAGTSHILLTWPFLFAATAGPKTATHAISTTDLWFLLRLRPLTLPSLEVHMQLYANWVLSLFQQQVPRR